MVKIKYYNISNLLTKDAEYNIILGQRSNGKSYAVKQHCVTESWNDSNKKFIVLRRLAEEVKPSLIEHYFSDVDIGRISNGRCDNIIVYRGQIWACRMDMEKLKNEKVRLLGYVLALVKASQYKSGIYTDCTNVIYEEFICEVGAAYMHDEPNILQSLISTIARNNRIHVYMVGNTISRVCPYFTEWQLVNIPRQKQGTIDVYDVETNQLDEHNKPVIIHIAVENAEQVAGAGKMFFGAASKMINEGTWHTSKQYPALPFEREEYSLIYTMVLIGHGFSFLMELLQKDGQYTWYVSRKTTRVKPGTRVVSDIYSCDPLWTNGFQALTAAENKALAILKQNKIAFCDSLTAEEFIQVKKNLGAY